jgi:excinuclease ABC subunit C
MLKFSNQQEFEKAATIRNQLRSLERLGIIHLSNLEPIGLDSAHLQLINILNLDPKTTKRIEGFDISHMGGKFNVASQVVFNNGLPLKKEYKKYKMNLAGNDDFAHMNEAISRRLSKKNIDAWGKPDLFLIDGGKGQLSSALKAIQLSQLNIPAFGLAKKQEQIVIAKNNSILQPNFNYLKETKRNYTADGDFYFINLSSKDPARLLIERIRNEAHRFAVNYHSLLKNRTSTDSQLTKIPGIGSSTAKKLLNTFGSVNNIKLASHEQIAGTIGNIKAKALKRVLK